MQLPTPPEFHYQCFNTEFMFYRNKTLIHTFNYVLTIIQNKSKYSYFRSVSKYCSWRGLGDFKCHEPCHVWSLSCGELQTYGMSQWEFILILIVLGLFLVHELGHNFDLAHAASFFDEKGKVKTNKKSFSYLFSF